MSMKHIATPDETARFESEVVARRSHMPDASAMHFEQLCETLGRLQVRGQKLHEKAARGDDDAAAQLIVLVDETYSLHAEMESQQS